MQLPVISAALAAAFVLAAAIAGHAPALSQDFSITNQAEPPNTGSRDVLRQLEAWWDVHAYYPRHASSGDEGGTVALHVVIRPDGNISAANVTTGSGSNSIDTAASLTFLGGYVRPLPEGAADANIDISLHYVLAHRHDQPVAAGYTPVLSKRPFTITNDLVKSPILDTMLQKTCTGEVVKQGIRNHPSYGSHYWAQAVFFRRPDGTPWVKFYEGGYPVLSPVTEVGKVVQWAGREERPNKGQSAYGAVTTQVYHYTVWPDGENKLSGSIYDGTGNDTDSINHGGTVDFTCATEVVPAVTWSAWSVTTAIGPRGDPP